VARRNIAATTIQGTSRDDPTPWRRGGGDEKEKKEEEEKGRERLRGRDSIAEADVKMNAQTVEDQRQAF